MLEMEILGERQGATFARGRTAKKRSRASMLWFEKSIVFDAPIE
jgi:hypothetical protein